MIEKDKTIEKYIEDHTSAENEILHEIYRETNLNTVQARMISGHVQGKILEFFSKMIKPKQILEIGTFTGYSAICLAKGLQPNGKLHTIDINDEVVEMAKKFIGKSDCAGKIKFYVGDAQEIIPQIFETFDIVFIDGDKRDYLKNYNLVFDKVTIGGYIFADNVLWSGKIVEELKPNDFQTKGIVEFNNFVQNDLRVENVLLPFRDGMMAIRKIRN